MVQSFWWRRGQYCVENVDKEDSEWKKDLDPLDADRDQLSQNI